MGVFDSFIKPESERKSKKESSRVYDAFSPEQSAGMQNVPGMPSIFRPRCFEDLYSVIDELKLGKSVIVHLTELKETTAIRVLDILTGAAYALNGTWKMLVSEVFIFSAQGDEQRF